MTGKTARKKRNTISITLWVLGVIVATLSLTSLLQDWSNVGFGGVLARILDYYRTISHAAKEALFDWWTPLVWHGFKLPEWAIDLMAVWLLCGFGVLRGVLAFDRSQGEPSFREKADGPIDPVAWWVATLILLFAPLAFVLFSCAAVVALYTVWKERNAPVTRGAPRHVLRDILALTGGMYAPLVGAAAFFAWNAIQL